RMVWHQGVGIANLFVNLDGPYKIDASFVRKHLAEAIAMAANIAEVDIKDLIARSEVANHVKDLLARILKHLGYGALAEIKSVIGAFLDTDEFFQPIYRPEHAIYTLVALRRHAWILRMAGHANLVFVGDWHGVIEKISNPLPELIRIYM